MDDQENADNGNHVVIQPGQNGNALELPLHIEHGVPPLIQENGNHLGLNGGLAIQQLHVQGGGFANGNHVVMQPGQNGNALELPLHIEHGVPPLIQGNGNHLGLNGGLAIQQLHVQDAGFDDVFANMDWMNVDLMEDNPQIQENGNHILQPVQQVLDGGFWYDVVDFDWLNIFDMVENLENDDQQEAVVGIQENGGWGNVAEPDEEIGEPLLELIPEAQEDLEPYWDDDDVNAEEQFNIFNMNPSDDFFVGVDEYIEGMGDDGEEDGGED